MTLAQNAQVADALLAHGVAAIRHAKGGSLDDYTEAQHALLEAVRLALLAEWSAGEGLDFEAAYYANVQNIAEDKHQAAIWWRAFVANHHLAGALDALDRQHRARLAAEREKWEAEVETLRGERDRAQENHHTALLTLREETRMRVHAEARVQRLEAGLKDYADQLDGECGVLLENMAGERERKWRAEVSVRLRALLPEETTNE